MIHSKRPPEIKERSRCRLEPSVTTQQLNQLGQNASPSTWSLLLTAWVFWAAWENCMPNIYQASISKEQLFFLSVALIYNNWSKGSYLLVMCFYSAVWRLLPITTNYWYNIFMNYVHGPWWLEGINNSWKDGNKTSL